MTPFEIRLRRRLLALYGRFLGLLAALDTSGAVAGALWAARTRRVEMAAASAIRAGRSPWETP